MARSHFAHFGGEGRWRVRSGVGGRQRLSGLPLAGLAGAGLTGDVPRPIHLQGTGHRDASADSTRGAGRGRGRHNSVKMLAFSKLTFPLTSFPFVWWWWEATWRKKKTALNSGENVWSSFIFAA